MSLLALTPVILVRAATGYARTGKMVDAAEAVGPAEHTFRLWTLAGEGRGATILHLWSVIRGDMRIMGPFPLNSDEARALPDRQLWRVDGMPGIFSTHRLREYTGITYESDQADDRALMADRSLARSGNLGLIVRSLLASALRTPPGQEQPDQVNLFDVSIANTTMEEALSQVITRAREEPRTGQADLVYFVNPGCLNIAVTDRSYRMVLHRASLILPDGIGLKVASRMKGIALRENVNGTDMFPRLCKAAADEGIPIFLLGARPGVAETAARAVQHAYPGLRIVGTHHGYISSHDDEVVDLVNRSGARLLLVAMGVPQQEMWCDRMRPRLDPGVIMGVGGLFDFYSGRIPRAPLWVRELGMEWVWRLKQEPRRMWRRYVIGNPLFLFRVWQEKTVRAPQGPSEYPRSHDDVPREC
ncbi:WecB/TagA/CpsF family glycosyltransferase [Austwickia chelonae]|uniref:Putative glycosyltransferase n=1 Tax=Austwickia chelonae NBRC 105200 TaxID=1184607 RepID=K6W4H3_9MICO|nr:WecB/TagA/CpsF family glycosyltransferase [Austwickia chelonae]GAB76707.1 putative glycosyltransferase [Austwickia chelonae NBRC 105200]